MKNKRKHLEKGTLGKGTLGKSLLVLITSLMCLSAFAGESILITTTRSDNPQEITIFKLVTSQTGDLEGLRIDNEPVIGINQLTQGVTTQEGYVSIPFRGKRYRKFVELKAAGKLNTKVGGLIDVFYLNNALTYKMASFRLSLERIGSKWQAYTSPSADHRPFNTMNFVIGKVGINQVEVAQKKSLFTESGFAIQEL